MLRNLSTAQIRCVPSVAIDSTTLTTSFSLMTSAAGLPAPCVQISIQNSSDVDIEISFDGSVPHFYVAAGYTVNLPERAIDATWANHMKVYVRSTTAAGTTGAIALSGIYYK